MRKERGVGAKLLGPEGAGVRALFYIGAVMGAAFFGLNQVEDNKEEKREAATAALISQFNLQALDVPEAFRGMADNFYVWPNQVIDGVEKDCIVQISNGQVLSIDCN